MSPKAGAHGELTGMMAIKAALLARGERRSVVLVPESAHGTNPATAALLGYRVEAVPARADGTVDAAEVERHMTQDVAAIMLTNPNTCGLFERDIAAIARLVHAAGAFVYADGAPGRHVLSLEMFDFPGVSRQGISVAAGGTYYFRVKLKDKSEKTLSAGASGGILGWAVAASAAGKAEPEGVFEFVVISDGKKAISDLRNASK